MKLILASESPRRRAILEEMRIPFEVLCFPVEEEKNAPDPETLTRNNARMKAEKTALRMPDALVLGADTVVWHHGTVLGKPADRAAAEDMLFSLSGTEHQVITGVALRSVENNIDISWCETTSVRFKPFSRETVQEYMKLVPVLDKAGAYGIQEHGDMLLESMEGELENVIGLPVKRLVQMLKELKCL